MADRAMNRSTDRVNRARRYAISTKVRYRVRGERSWNEGVMENMSISGVLFRADNPLVKDTVIEMRFFLPVELNGECAAEVLCRGSVIRATHCGVPGGPVNIAARIVHSRFLRQMEKREQFAEG